MQDAAAAPARNTKVSLDAERAAQTLATPTSIRRLCSTSRKALKLRLTLFLQPNHGFGESFNGSGHSRPHHFLAAGKLAILPKTARKLAKTLDQGIGTVQ